MRKLTLINLMKILDNHQDWLSLTQDGDSTYIAQRADLSYVDLSGVNLAGMNLMHVNFQGSNLSKANLKGANLMCANLSETDLDSADLSEANLSYASLCMAELYNVDLSGADLTNAKLPDFQIPQDEDLIVWKKIEENTLVKLKIPKEAKRTACLINKKCRAEYAEVLEIIGEGKYSKHDKSFAYEVGKVVKPDSYNDDIRHDCMPGIHFFMTKEEAKKY